MRSQKWNATLGDFSTEFSFSSTKSYTSENTMSHTLSDAILALCFISIVRSRFCFFKKKKKFFSFSYQCDGKNETWYFKFFLVNNHGLLFVV